jgi:hypothetical protein
MAGRQPEFTTGNPNSLSADLHFLIVVKAIDDVRIAQTTLIQVRGEISESLSIIG